MDWAFVKYVPAYKTITMQEMDIDALLMSSDFGSTVTVSNCLA
jgi:hypothetical protein